MDKLAYDKLVCELTCLSGPMGFVPSDGNPSGQVEVWKLPTGEFVYLAPSDTLTDSQRDDQIAVIMELLRSD